MILSCLHEIEARVHHGMNRAKIAGQCVKCGRRVGGSIERTAFSPAALAHIPPWKLHKRPGRRKVRYQAYLSSMEWKRLRMRCLDLANHTCFCGEPATDAHHLTYRADIRDTKLIDLAAVCRGCHRQIDGKAG